MKNPRILMIGLTPPLEGGSQTHIYGLSSRIKNCNVLTQRGSICTKKIELPAPKKPAFLRNLIFSFLAKIYVLSLLFSIRKKYDIIHIHENLLYFCAIPLSLRYKVVVTVHGIKGFKFYENKFLWFFFRQGLKFADKIICPDLIESQMLIKERFRNISWIPNSVDLNIYKKIRAESEKKITFVGRMHEQKGIRYLLEAFEIVSRKHPDYRLQMIGRINDYAMKLKRNHPNNKIIWKGFILDRKRLFSEILSSGILVYPSLWEAAPWPALLEGMASGRPVIASNLPGMKRLFNDRKDILLVEAKNSKKLAESINLLIADKRLSKKIGSGGKKTAIDYSLDSMAKKTIAIYE